MTIFNPLISEMHCSLIFFLIYCQCLIFMNVTKKHQSTSFSLFIVSVFIFNFTKIQLFLQQFAFSCCKFYKKCLTKLLYWLIFPPSIFIFSAHFFSAWLFFISANNNWHLESSGCILKVFFYSIVQVFICLMYILDLCSVLWILYACISPHPFWWQ